MREKLSNRTKLLRMTRGEVIDSSLCYDIEFSVPLSYHIFETDDLVPDMR